MIVSSKDSYKNYISKYDEARLHVEALMNAHIITLDLNIRILIPLSDAGVNRVKELLALANDRKRLRKIKQIGERSERYIREALLNAGLMGMEKE